MFEIGSTGGMQIDVIQFEPREWTLLSKIIQNQEEVKILDLPMLPE